MKRSFALVLALLMLLLTACGSGNTAEPAKAAAAPEKTETAAPAEAAAPKGIKPGTVEGNTYTNVFFNVTCTLDSDWTVLTDAEIAEMQGITSDMLDEEYAKLLEEDNSTLTDFYASAADGLYSINTTVSKVGILAGAVIDESAFIDSALDGEENLVDALKSMGMVNVTAEKREITIAGRDTYGVYVYGEYEGIPIYETIAVLKEGQYFLCITIAAWGDDICEPLLGYFTAIE